MWVDRFGVKMKLTRVLLATLLNMRIHQCKVSELLYIFPLIYLFCSGCIVASCNWNIQTQLVWHRPQKIITGSRKHTHYFKLVLKWTRLDLN
jgi:hypothetical protein